MRKNRQPTRKTEWDRRVHARKWSVLIERDFSMPGCSGWLYYVVGYGKILMERMSYSQRKSAILGARRLRALLINTAHLIPEAGGKRS